MEMKKVNNINRIGLLLTAACFIYFFVIYIIMFTAEPNYYALRLTSGQVLDYLLKIIVCIAVFIVFVVELIAVPYYFFTKRDGRFSVRQNRLGKIIIICGIIDFLLILIFWINLGVVFDGNAANAESTVYRIIDLCVSIASFGGIYMLVGYTPHFDSIAAMKKKRKKI